MQSWKETNNEFKAEGLKLMISVKRANLACVCCINTFSQTSDQFKMFQCPANPIKNIVILCFKNKRQKGLKVFAGHKYSIVLI